MLEPPVQTPPPTDRPARRGRAAGTVVLLGWWLDWGPLLLLSPAVVLFIPSAWPRWAFMWTLAVAIYGGAKWLTWRKARVQGAPLWQHAGYLLAWPGLDADAFLSPPSSSRGRTPTPREWLFAAGKFALGLGVFFGAARWVPSQFPYLVGWVGMIGLALVLHFGIFHVLSCTWRSVGVEARPLMHWPLAAVSVSEFWGRRWNTAFRDLTHRFLFRPLTAWLGARLALGAGFLFSGLVHDLVISVPAGGGYGGPTLFFVLQAAALFVERGTLARRLGLGQGWRGWLFTMLVLMAPACLLFHPPFVVAIIVPFLRFLGAI